MTIGWNIWMICLILIWFFYGLSRMLQFPQFVWALRSSVWDGFINFLLIYATNRSKICSDQERFFIPLSLYPLSFFPNTPFNRRQYDNKYLMLTKYLQLYKVQIFIRCILYILWLTIKAWECSLALMFTD